MGNLERLSFSFLKMSSPKAQGATGGKYGRSRPRQLPSPARSAHDVGSGSGGRTATIQASGRWRSASYLRYIRGPRLPVWQTCWDITIVRFFSKFGPHSKIQFENITRLSHEFLETLARPEKAHFSFKFSKNKLKLRKYNPVVAVRGWYKYLLQETKNTLSMEYGVKSRFTLILRSVRSRFTCKNFDLFSRLL